MTKENYIKRVLLIMNEAGLIDTLGNSMLGADTAQVDRYIEGSYVDAWRQCAKVMPRNWFENKDFTDRVPTPNLAQGTGYVVLPDNFYLLTAFRMTGWKKTVYEAGIEDEKISSIQSNEYTRGSTIRPVCTISSEWHNGEIRGVLNYYSLPKGLSAHKVEKAIYVPVVEPVLGKMDDYELRLTEQVIEPIAYLSAATVFTMFEKYDIAKALEQRAISMFPGLQSVRGKNITVKQ
jgi:hypothetical protein